MLPDPVIVSNGSVDIAVRAHGEPDAPVLICLHGWPDSSRGWRHVAPLLADRYRVLTPDLRGFANSSKPIGTGAYRMGDLMGDVLAVARWAGSDRFYLAGHDFGSAITWSMATFMPERIERAVTLAAPHPMVMKRAAGDLRQIMKAAYTFLLNLGEQGEALMRSEDFELLRRFAFGGDSIITDQEFAGYKAEWAQPGTFTAMAEYYRAHYRPDLLNRDVALELPPTPVPVRYIHGLRDFSFIPELATGNADFVAGEYDEVHLDTSHWMLYEEPGRVAELIADWCR
jgi:pimeloyl-ACP methyl ester carboxylesterase